DAAPGARLRTLLALLIVAAPSVVAARPAKHKAAPATLDALIAEADKAFVDSYFEVAANKAQALLSDPRLTDATQIEHVPRTLAFSDYYIGQGSAAETVLGDVFKKNPDATIDAASYPPPLVEFFNQVKAKVLKRPDLAGLVVERPLGLHPAWAFAATGA